MISTEFWKSLNYKIAALIAGLLLSYSATAQSEERIKIDSAFLFMQDTAEFFVGLSKIDPVKAALYSAALPGLGQAYNGQYWKIPLIYGGLMGFAHMINRNNKLYNQFRSAQIAISSRRPDLENPFDEFAEGVYSEASINRNAERFRRNRDYMMILAGAFYLINIAEAHIAAHLKEFDINEELSLKLTPSLQSTPLFSRSAGLSLTLRF